MVQVSISNATLAPTRCCFLFKRLREELKDIALKKCDSDIAKFVACSREKGMLVIFSCRQQSKEMNACLNSVTNEENFQKYKTKREAELAGAGTA
ncbi:unnamed protein product [Choristocarpus tenellus]